MKKMPQVVLLCMTLFIVPCRHEASKCVFCKGTKVCDGVSCSFCGATGRQFGEIPKAKQMPKARPRTIPKAEYEEWLEEHRKSQNGPRIGNGG